MGRGGSEGLSESLFEIETHSADEEQINLRFILRRLNMKSESIRLGDFKIDLDGDLDDLQRSSLVLFLLFLLFSKSIFHPTCCR